MTTTTVEKLAEMRAAAIASRNAMLTMQAAQTKHIDGYIIRPSIGSTVIGEYVGWELIPPKNSGPEWYFMTYEQCVDALPRHKARY